MATTDNNNKEEVTPRRPDSIPCDLHYARWPSPIHTGTFLPGCAIYIAQYIGWYIYGLNRLRKMSAVQIHNVLSTEITAIPSWMRAAFKGHYNNTLCNGATWMLVLWKVLHILYSRLIDAYLKKLKTKEYIRTRITNSLWYCAFYSSILAYCILTIDRDKMNIIWGRHVALSDDLPTQTIVAYTVICTFYLHTALVEGIQNGSLHLFLKFLLMVVACVLSYILRLLEIPFTLSALLATTTISEELTKVFCSLLNPDKFVGSLYIFNLVLFTFIHLVITPVLFLMPLGKMIFYNGKGAILTLLFSSLLLWLCSAIYNSIISKSVVHWLYHKVKEESNEEEEQTEVEKSKQMMRCPGNLIECSLFPVRTDEAYVLRVLRSEMQERKSRMDARKKPKGKNAMLMQTLKCMMVIRKKLKQKKKSENSDSDESSETEDATEDHNTAGDRNADDDIRRGGESKKVENDTKEDKTQKSPIRDSGGFKTEHNVLADDAQIIAASSSDYNPDTLRDIEAVDSVFVAKQKSVGRKSNNDNLKTEIVSSNAEKGFRGLDYANDKEQSEFISDDKSGSKTDDVPESIVLEETPKVPERDGNKEPGNLNERKSKVKVSTNFQKRADIDK